MWASPTVKNSTHQFNLLQNYLQPSTKLARILCSLSALWTSQSKDSLSKAIYISYD